jgi:ribosomal protein S18 acetylase RimI-like enzyme
MILRDWREADPAAVHACYERERQHWLDGLSWDTTWTWATVEQARFARGLPGFLAINDAGGVDGWTFYVVDDNVLHIGGLVADSDAATRSLLDGVLHGSEQTGAEATACFVLDRASGLGASLEQHGFAVERFLYLSVPLVDGGGLPLPPSHEASADHGSPGEGGQLEDRVALDAWRDGDLERVAALLAASYAPHAGRHFAPTGNWEKYTTGLVEQAGCGVFDATLTRVVRGDAGVRAAVLVTTVSPSAAHIAQIAVHPDWRGRGFASHLLRDAAERSVKAGKTELTLLVSEQNETARRLYASMGFAQKATFLAARRDESRTARFIAAS